MRYLGDFFVGQQIGHALTKTVTESDNNLFCLLTMNHHPVHLDSEYAKKAKHGQILVVGTLVFSLVVGLTVGDISRGAIANLRYGLVDHLRPVFIGDTLRAESEVLAVRPSRAGNTGVVSVQTIAFNQKGERVLILERSVLLPVKP